MREGHKSQITSHKYGGVIERYREYLPVTQKTPVVTLLEGSTPLIYAGYLSKLASKSCEV